QDDVATAIVVMGRTEHTNDIIPKVQAEVANLNSDGSLPPGVKVVPYYDRSSLVAVTTHTVLHNLVLRGEDANLLSLGAVDFGIIVDSAVIMMENIYRNFQSSTDHHQSLLARLAGGYWVTDSTVEKTDKKAGSKWTDRLRLIFISAMQVDKAVFFTAAITVTAF